MNLACLLGWTAFFVSSVQATFSSKNLSRIFCGGGALASSTTIFGQPYLKKLERSDESLEFWADSLQGPSAEILFQYHLFPKFVLDGRYRTSQATVFLRTLFKYESGITKRLLEAGADPNVTDTWGTDFISHALSRNFPLSLLQLAIDRGLSVNHCNRDGKLPLDRALKFNNYEVARILIQAGAGSVRSWSEIIYSLACFNGALPSSAKELKESESFGKHRLILEIYRASGRNKQMMSLLVNRPFWLFQPKMREFLLKIDQFYRMMYEES